MIIARNRDGAPVVRVWGFDRHVSHHGDPKGGTMLVRGFQPGDEADIGVILLGAFDAGELPGYLRADLDGVVARLPGDLEGTLLAVEEGRVLGLYQPHYPLLVVNREFRRQGIGRHLVEVGLDRARARGDGELLLAPPRGSTVATAFCESLGFHYRSSLWGMELSPNIVVPPPEFPPRIDARPLRSTDEQPYVDLINATFADHPSPLHVTAEQVRLSHRLPGCGPDGVLVLTPIDCQDDLIGFCRTTAVPEDAGIHLNINQLGVLPEWRGQGLGRGLLRWGVMRLRAIATAPVYLAVEAENQRALALYERTGFRRVEEWPRWSRPLTPLPPTGSQGEGLRDFVPPSTSRTLR